MDKSNDQIIKIKKYANRRLYNMAESKYITLDDLSNMIRDNKEFIVYDAKTGEDITRSVLTQIIVEEESKGKNLLPESFLKKIISFYGNNMQNVIPQYLDYSMKMFVKNQESMTDYFDKTMKDFYPSNSFEEMGKKNMELMEKTFQMFFPHTSPSKDKKEEETQKTKDDDVSLDSLKEQLDKLEKKLNRLKDEED